MSTWHKLLAILLLVAVAVPATAGSRKAGAKKSVIRGRVTSVDTGRPVAGAKVAIPGVGRARTKKNGRFVIRTKRNQAGTARVKIRAKGHVVRETNVIVPAPGGKTVENWNLLPRASDGFDLALFDAIARPDGVIRWDSPPTFRIIRNRIECRGGLVDGLCVEWFASTAAVPEPMLGWLRRGAAEMGTLATSGRPPRIVEVELSPGQSFDFDEALRYCQVKSKSPRSARSMNPSTHTQRALHLGPRGLIRSESS